MSAAVLDVYCHSCARTSSGTQYPDAVNDEGDRICPQCTSEFVELREQLAAAAAAPAPTHPIATNSTRRTFTTPNGVNMEVHVTTALLPPEMYDVLARQQPSGLSMVFALENGALMPGSNLRSFQFENNEFEALLDRLAQQYRPAMQPTPQEVLDSLPRRPVRGGEQDSSADPGAPLFASCSAGEPCPVCHDEFAIDTTVTELPCQHCFHEDCILPWLQEHNTCPVCRYKLDNDAMPHHHHHPPTHQPPRNRAAGDDSPRNNPPPLVDSDSESDSDDQQPPALIASHEVHAQPPPPLAPFNADADDRSADDTITRDLQPGQLLQQLARQFQSRFSEAPASSPAAEFAAAANLNPAATGISMHPVRTSSGSASVRTGPYTRLDEELRSAAAVGEPSAAGDAARHPQATASQQGPINTRLTAELSSLAARRQDLLHEAHEVHEANRNLHERLVHLLERHAAPDARAAGAGGAPAEEDGGTGGGAPGPHLSTSQLEDLREEINAAADLADSMLLELPQAAPSEAAAGQAGGGAAAAAGRAGGAAADSETDPRTLDRTVVWDPAGGGLFRIVVNDPRPPATQEPATQEAAMQEVAQPRPTRVPSVIHLVSGMLGWAFRRVRSLLHLH